MTTGALLLLSTLFLGMGVFEFDGLYSIIALTWMTLSFVALLLAALGYLGKLRIPVEPPAEWMLVLALLFCVYIANFKLPASFVDPAGAFTYAFFRLQTAVAASLVLVFFLVPRSPRTFKYLLLIAAVFVAVILRVWLLSASPTPQIDVFSASTQAAQLLAEGTSPYLPHEDGSIAFHYPPLNAYLHALSYWLVDDIRAIYIIAELTFALFLFLAAKRSMDSVRAGLLACLFLFHPRSLFTLDLAWTEPPILAFLGLALFLFARGRRNAAAAAYGLMLSLKQYLVFFLLHWWLLDRSWKRFAILVAATVATVVPFFFIDTSYLIEHGFLQTVLRGGVRSDSLTFVTFLSATAGITLPRMTSVIVGLIFSFWTFRAFRQYPPLPAFLFSSALTTFALFLFGAQAFANYYYVVSGLVLLLIAYHTEEGMARE